MGSQVTDAFIRASAKALISSGLAQKGYENAISTATRVAPTCFWPPLSVRDQCPSAGTNT